MTNAARKTDQPPARQTLEEFLTSQYYQFLIPDGPRHFYGLSRMIFTWGLFVKLEWTGYSHRYCYHTQLEALGALKDWQKLNFEGEPKGFIKRKPELHHPVENWDE